MSTLESGRSSRDAGPMLNAHGNSASHCPARKPPPPDSRLAPDFGPAHDTSDSIVSRDTYRGPRPHESRLPDAVKPPDGWTRHPLRRADLVFAALIVAAGILARWPFVEAGRTLLNPDEAIVGLMAQDIAAGARLPIYFYGQRYMGSLEAFLIAAAAPLFDDPVIALRFAPSCVFALFAALQYLMLTRWFGRRGGWVGAAVLLAASPMFVHWSVSARGGYVEILLWGTALLWAYSEWFVGGAGAHPGSLPPRSTRARRFAFGAILGSGFWINPTIMLFALPVLLHALLGRPLAALDDAPRAGGLLRALRRTTGRATLPILAAVAVLALNATWTSWVDGGQVKYLALLGLAPRPVAAAILGATGIVAGILLWRRTMVLHHARAVLMANAAMIVGAAVGATPALVYMAQTTLGLRPLDPSLPMGIRPLWLIGETLVYLMYGLPLLFQADPRPFVQLMGVGYEDVTRPLSITASACATAGNWLVLGGIATCVAILIRSQARPLSHLFALRPFTAPPALLLLIAFGLTIALYVLGACTMNFTTVRYLVPLWAFFPGLIAAACTDSRRLRTSAAALAFMLCGWTAGQVCFRAQLGADHSLSPVADALVRRGVTHVVAEPLDAHLLSFLTRRRCQIEEFESFWVRLPHHQRTERPGEPATYLVQTGVVDCSESWTDAGWPGWASPEAMRFLWPRMQWALARDPNLLVSREPLAAGYELIRLRARLPRPSARMGEAKRVRAAADAPAADVATRLAASPRSGI